MAEQFSLDTMDLESTMGAAFDAAQDVPSEAPSEPEAPAAPTHADELAAALKDDGGDNAPAPEEAAAETDTPDPGEETAADPDESQSVTPPARWSAEQKAEFTALPPEAQAIVLRREREMEAAFTQKTQELAEQRRGYEAIESAIAPHRQRIAQAGMSEADAVRYLVDMESYATRDPVGYMRMFAQHNGIDLAGLTAGTGAPTDDGDMGWTDPETQQLHQRIAGLEQRLQAADREQAERQQAEVRSEIETFTSEMTDAGEPAHPHYETVKGHMAAMLQSGAAKDLQHAYDMAVWAHGETRQTMLKQRKAEDEAQRIKEAKAAAAAAKRAKGTQPRSTQQPITVSDRPLADMEKTMAEVYDRVNGAS